LTKDNFKILKVIGRGSFGKVFLVEKRHLGSSLDADGGKNLGRKIPETTTNSST
jgi:serine/threonine protein kinase